MNAADTIQQQARRPLPSPNQVHPDAGDRNAGFGTIRRLPRAYGWHAVLTDSTAPLRKSALE